MVLIEAKRYLDPFFYIKYLSSSFSKLLFALINKKKVLKKHKFLLDSSLIHKIYNIFRLSKYWKNENFEGYQKYFRILMVAIIFSPTVFILP